VIKNNSLAKPYARAIFNIAIKQQKLSDWLQTLQILAAVVASAPSYDIWRNPKFTPLQQLGFLIAIVEQLNHKVTPFEHNLLQILASKRQLTLLPQIEDFYEKLYFDNANILTAQVTTTIELPPALLEKIRTTLEKLFRKTINIQCKIEPSLIGGIVIRAADYVIDGSVRSKLASFV
jgi:F-type H+-transporting ATPase subunit delta